MKKTPKAIKSLLKRVSDWNEDYMNYVQTTGDTELPSVDTTCFSYYAAKEYIIKVYKTKVVVLDPENNRYELKSEFNGDFCLLDLSLKYDRRRLSKAWRIWKSDHPDAEELKDTEEE